MTSACSPALASLVRRAAEITRPFNAADSVMMIRSLYTLRVPSPYVQPVCEKAAFVLASVDKASVDSTVLTEMIHCLTSLKLHTSPVVHDVLVRRLARVATSLSTSTLHRAIFSVLKMERKFASPAACTDMLKALYSAIEREPEDSGLRLAYVALFPYTSLVQQGSSFHEVPLLTSSNDIRPSWQALLTSAQHLVNPKKLDLNSLTGDKAWSAAHLYIDIVLAEAAIKPQGSKKASWSPTVVEFAESWRRVRQAADGRINFLSFPFARYASLVSAFPELLECGISSVLDPLTERQDMGTRDVTRYDVAKLAGRLGSSVKAAHKNTAPPCDGELLRACQAVLMMAMSFLQTRLPECDLATLASVWHATAALVAKDALPSTPEVLPSLGRASQGIILSVVHTADPSKDTCEQLLWLTSSLLLVTKRTPCADVKDLLQEDVVPCLSSLPLKKVSVRSLCQLWHSMAVAASLQSPTPLSQPVLEQLTDAIMAVPVSAMSSADVGMLLSGCEHLISSAATEDAAVMACTLAALEHVLCDRANSRGTAEACALQLHSLQVCFSFLQEHAPEGASEKQLNRLVAKALDKSNNMARASREPATPQEALDMLTASPSGGRASPSPATLAMVCSASTTWTPSEAESAQGRTHYCTVVLKCAEICYRHGCGLVFSRAALSTKAKTTFVFPVEQLLTVREGGAGSTNAAHCVRLMADTMVKSGSIAGADRETVTALVDYALSTATTPKSKLDSTVPGTLFLLHANKLLSVSNKLFNRTQLTSLLHQSETLLDALKKELEGNGEERIPRDGEDVLGSIHRSSQLKSPHQLLRVTRALLNSQLLSRLGQQSLSNSAVFKQNLAFVANICVPSPPSTTADKELLMKIQLLLDV